MELGSKGLKDVSMILCGTLGLFWPLEIRESNSSLCKEDKQVVARPIPLGRKQYYYYLVKHPTIEGNSISKPNELLTSMYFLSKFQYFKILCSYGFCHQNALSI